MKQLFLAFIFTFSFTLSCVADNWIVCGEQGFSGHIQGIAADESGIYWSFIDTLLKTDYNGKKLFSYKSVPHCGDICIAEGKIYVTMGLRNKNIKEHNGHRSWIFVHDAKDLKLLKKHKIHCSLPDGIAFANGRFYVGSSPGKELHKLNPLLVYDKNFNLLKQYDLDIEVPTRYGIQTLNIVNGKLLASFYSKLNHGVFFKLNDFSKMESLFPVNTSYGAAVVPEKIAGTKNVFLIAHSSGTKKNYSAKLLTVKYNNGKLIPFKLPQTVNKQ